MSDSTRSRPRRRPAFVPVIRMLRPLAAARTPDAQGWVLARMSRSPEDLKTAVPVRSSGADVRSHLLLVAEEPPKGAITPGSIPNVAAMKMDARNTHPGARITAWRLAIAPSVTVLDTVTDGVALLTAHRGAHAGPGRGTLDDPGFPCARAFATPGQRHQSGFHPKRCSHDASIDVKPPSGGEKGLRVESGRGRAASTAAAGASLTVWILRAAFLLSPYARPGWPVPVDGGRAGPAGGRPLKQ